MVCAGLGLDVLAGGNELRQARQAIPLHDARQRVADEEFSVIAIELERDARART